jgi:hypothetical protein
MRQNCQRDCSSEPRHPPAPPTTTPHTHTNTRTRCEGAAALEDVLHYRLGSSKVVAWLLVGQWILRHGAAADELDFIVVFADAGVLLPAHTVPR